MNKFWGSSLIAVGVVLFAGVSFANDCNTDYNGDGVTNESDVAVLQAALGAREGDSDFVAQADHDGDGEISVLDYGILLGCN